MKLQLNESVNWQQIVDKNIAAVQVTSSYHAPIPSIKIETDIDTHILAVLITSTEAKKTWNWAGSLIQESFLIANALGVSNKSLATHNVWLNQINLITFPEYTDVYRISFSIPEWFTTVSIKVWKYVGSDVDTVSTLEKVQSIESKIDDISSYGR